MREKENYLYVDSQERNLLFILLCGGTAGKLDTEVILWQMF